VFAEVADGVSASFLAPVCLVSEQKPIKLSKKAKRVHVMFAIFSHAIMVTEE